MIGVVNLTVKVCSSGASEVYSPSIVPASRTKPSNDHDAGVPAFGSFKGKVMTKLLVVPGSSKSAVVSKITVKVSSCASYSVEG